MQEEITIYRSDCEQPWGFRLEGGQSKGEPFIISHVCYSLMHIQFF